MNILMATGECLPFSKTGGLADVAYSLSKELVKLGHNVSVCVPLYKPLDKKYRAKHLYSLEIIMNWRKPKAEIYHAVHEGIDYYFIQNDYYFSRNGGLYGYFDDGERFAFFSNTVIELIKRLPYKIDILHSHDWQSGMLPCLINEKYKDDPDLGNIKTVLTIHNPLFKGYFDPSSLYDLYNLDSRIYNEGKVRFDGQVSTLKAGIYYANKITTVSPTHAYELTTPEGSMGLWYDLVIRSEDFRGIVNGMDYKEFNPRTDKIIYNNYNTKNYKEEKVKNKIAFSEAYGLEKDRPLYAVVSRLTDQKGLDLMFAMAEYVVTHGGNFAVVGSGEQYAEDFFNQLYLKYPHNVMVYIGYNNDIAHKVYAASDFFIMPSAFEPCGLGQMIAQRYGSLPIVRRTGGLKDSVIPYRNNRESLRKADGFGFDYYSVEDAVNMTDWTLRVYYNEKKVFEKLQLNALKADHKWMSSALKYIEVYEDALKK